ncbi:MAG: HD domain-containing protein [Oscillospiraceae bacterium]
MIDIAELTYRAIEYDKGDPRRIQHFIKVHSFARLIGTSEKLTAEDMNILEAAAVLHDIGIHNCEQKYRSTSGKYQQTEGVPVARDILSDMKCSDNDTEKICFLIARHHTYDGVNSVLWRILLEADFLVNAYEDNMSEAAVKTASEKIFGTASGKKLLNDLFLGEKYNV